MSAAQTQNKAISSKAVENDDVCRGSRFGMSGTAKLIEIAMTLAAAASAVPLPGFCPSCQSYHDPRVSTAEHPNVFCSQGCEQAFLRQALAALSLEDCIRIQQRLERLLTRVETVTRDQESALAARTAR